MPSRIDETLTAVARRPLPALAALVLGLLIGFTMVVAAGGQDEPPTQAAAPVTTTTAVGDPAPAPAPKKPKKAKTPAPQPEPKQVGRLAEAAQAAIDAAGGSPAGVAVTRLSGGKTYRAGEDRPFEAWSTIKIPAIVLYLANNPSPSGDAVQKIEAAIRQSSNLDMRALYKALVAKLDVREANRQLRDLVANGGGQLVDLPDRKDPSIDDSVPIGNSRWTPASAAGFLRELAAGCLLEQPADARLVLTQMNNLTEGGWGAPVVFPRDRVFAKAGWAEDGSTVSQMALVGRGSDAYVVAVMTEPGSYPGGQRLIEKMLRAFKAVAGTPAGGGEPLPRSCGLSAGGQSSGGEADDLALPGSGESETIEPDAGSAMGTD